MSDHNKLVGAIVTLVVGAAVGGGIGYAMGNNKSDDSKKSDSSMSATTTATDGVTVGGAKMVSNLDIVDNAVHAKNVTTVVSLVQKAGLVDTLKSTGPFTVFAPNNDAFNAVPKATLDKVAGNVDLLKTVLTYHVVSGTYTTADLRALAAKGEKLTTVQGAQIGFVVKDNKVYITDVAGQTVEIETNDIVSSNGVTHVIKNVLLPVDPSTL